MQERGTVTALTGPTDGDVATAPAATRRAPVKRVLVAAAVAAGVVVVDQLTKWWALDRLSHGSIHLVGPLSLTLTRNRGSAFSLFQGQAPLLVTVAVVLVVVLLLVARAAPGAGRAAAIGLIVGGAIGNLADRLFRSDHGAVVDFIALHLWPTFNVADSCIVVGTILVAVSVLRGSPG